MKTARVQPAARANGETRLERWGKRGSLWLALTVLSCGHVGIDLDAGSAAEDGTHEHDDYKKDEDAPEHEDVTEDEGDEATAHEDVTADEGEPSAEDDEKPPHTEPHPIDAGTAPARDAAADLDAATVRDGSVHAEPLRDAGDGSIAHEDDALDDKAPDDDDVNLDDALSIDDRLDAGDAALPDAADAARRPDSGEGRRDASAAESPADEEAD